MERSLAFTQTHDYLIERTLYKIAIKSQKNNEYTESKKWKTKTIKWKKANYIQENRIERAVCALHKVVVVEFVFLFARYENKSFGW